MLGIVLGGPLPVSREARRVMRIVTDDVAPPRKEPELKEEQAAKVILAMLRMLGEGCEDASAEKIRLRAKVGHEVAVDCLEWAANAGLVRKRFADGGDGAGRRKPRPVWGLRHSIDLQCVSNSLHIRPDVSRVLRKAGDLEAAAQRVVQLDARGDSQNAGTPVKGGGSTASGRHADLEDELADLAVRLMAVGKRMQSEPGDAMRCRGHEVERIGFYFTQWQRSNESERSVG